MLEKENDKLLTLRNRRGWWGRRSPQDKSRNRGGGMGDPLRINPPSPGRGAGDQLSKEYWYNVMPAYIYPENNGRFLSQFAYFITFLNEPQVLNKHGGRFDQRK